MWSLLQAVLNGLLTGSLYALIGMGMALIFGVMRIVNFAHGEFLMLGMYVSYVLFDRLGVNPPGELAVRRRAAPRPDTLPSGSGLRPDPTPVHAMSLRPVRLK